MSYRTSWKTLFSRLRRMLVAGVARSSHIEFAAWLRTLQGKKLSESQGRLVKQLLKDSGSGYHFMVLGEADLQQIRGYCDYSHFFSLGQGDRPVQAFASSDELPLPSDTVDTVMLYHELEYSENPHRVLNEACRVILPGGHLIIVIFNPFSLFGVYSLVRRLFSGKALWQRHAIRGGRLLDWLKILHMQPVAIASAGYFLPDWLIRKTVGTKVQQALLKRKCLPFGAYTVIVAKKVVAKPVAPGMKSWRLVSQAQKVSNGLVPKNLNRAPEHMKSISKNPQRGYSVEEG